MFKVEHIIRNINFPQNIDRFKKDKPQSLGEVMYFMFFSELNYGGLIIKRDPTELVTRSQVFANIETTRVTGSETDMARLLAAIDIFLDSRNGRQTMYSAYGITDADAQEQLSCVHPSKLTPVLELLNELQDVTIADILETFGEHLKHSEGSCY